MDLYTLAIRLTDPFSWDEGDVAYTNRDIFGRELWLCCYLQAQRNRIWSLWEAWATLTVKVTLARAEAQGQWGRELWLCAWMVAAPRLAWVEGKQFALCELRNVCDVSIDQTIFEMLYDEQYGFHGRLHKFPVPK